MPDNKPMTPEEFAEHILKSLGFYVYLTGDVSGHLCSDITARDESIRREYAPLVSAAKEFIRKVDEGEARSVRSYKQFSDVIRALPIDTPPAAERMQAADYGRSKSNDKRLRALDKPEADPSFNDSLRKSDWKNDERLKDIAHDPSLMPDAIEIKPEAVCPRCEGKKKIRVMYSLVEEVIACPDCHGTGKRGAQ